MTIPPPSDVDSPDSPEERAKEKRGEKATHKSAYSSRGRLKFQIWTDLPDDARKLLTRGALWLGAILGAIIVIAFLFYTRDWVEQRRTTEAVARARQNVQVSRPRQSDPTFSFQLPGTAEPIRQATLYARINGYLRKRNVDIGDQVKTGQVLAVIDAPDLDAQLAQAKAQVEQYRAALKYAKATFGREKELLSQKVASQQDYDQSEASYQQGVANLDASTSNVASLEAQHEFEKIVAPFDGTITARYLDEGALISIGTNSTSPSIFQISGTDVLRVFLFVPQVYVSNIRVGDPVKISIPEYPEEEFAGTITRFAGALDPQVRTERVEVDIPNQEGKLKAGMYLDVVFTAGQQKPALVVPASVLSIGTHGTKIATVGADQKVKFVTVKLGRDFGPDIEVLKGLGGDEQMIMNPPADLRDGDPVTIVNAKK